MVYCINYKNGEAQSTPTMIEMINNEMKRHSKLYASLNLTNNQISEIRLNCTNDEITNLNSTESCYELGDISKDWEMIKEELKDNKMPRKWYDLFQNAKIMKQKTMDEKVMKENQKVTEPEHKEVIKENTEQSVEIKERKEENVKQPKNTSPIVNRNLPPISNNSSYAVLGRRGQFQLNMQICGDITTMQSDGCKLYLTDIKTGHLYISSSSEITIPKAKLLSASDHSVMNVLSNFIINFTEDDKKLAFERAKRYLEIADNNNITKTPSSRNIQDIFLDVVEYTKRKALEAKEIINSSDDYKYDEQEGTVAIISGQFQKLLDEVDAGCTKTIFCKKLRLIEQHYAEKIIISNRCGSGYGFNDSNNKRYYKFKIVSFKKKEDT